MASNDNKTPIDRENSERRKEARKYKRDSRSSAYHEVGEKKKEMANKMLKVSHKGSIGHSIHDHTGKMIKRGLEVKHEGRDMRFGKTSKRGIVGLHAK